MKILLIGHGKMGKAIEEFAIDRGHTIVAVIDANDTIMDTLAEQADVAIEFTHPDAAFENIKFCIERNLPVVCGTTGWLDQYEAVEKLVQEHDGTFLYASNFSIGVNLFFKLNKYLAKVMKEQERYRPSMIEVHHTEKKDAPSGTAITLAEGIMSENDKFTQWKNEKTNEENTIEITSERIGQVPGTHKITYKSAVDQINIEHEAFSREGFVQGAVFVAEWLPSQKGIKDINDFLKL